MFYVSTEGERDRHLQIPWKRCYGDMRQIYLFDWTPAMCETHAHIRSRLAAAYSLHSTWKCNTEAAPIRARNGIGRLAGRSCAWHSRLADGTLLNPRADGNFYHGMQQRGIGNIYASILQEMGRDLRSAHTLKSRRDCRRRGPTDVFRRVRGHEYTQIMIISEYCCSS